MSELRTTDITALLQRGRAAALAGDLFAARGIFRQAAEIDPDCAEAWIGLSTAVPILAEKRSILMQALKIDPGHPEAHASLLYIDQLLAEGAVIAPSHARRGREPEPAREPARDEAAEAPAATHCYLHPERETALLCVQCNQPICGTCAQTAAVGQLCPPCRRERRPVNYKVAARHLALAGLTAVPAALLAGALLSMIGFGFFYFGLLIGAVAGEGVIRLTDLATRGKRGRPMQITVGAGLVVGTLLGGALAALLTVAGMDGAALAQLPPEEAAEVAAELPRIALTAMLTNAGMWIYLLAAVATTSLRLR
jgi:hypothetical protein